MDINEFLKKLTTTITEQSKRIDALEAKIASLESRPVRARKTRNLGQRVDGSRREIAEEPRVLVVAAHLMRTLNVPAYRIALSGLLSQSKADGVRLWGDDNTRQFAAEHGLEDVLENGVTVAELASMVTNMDALPEVTEKVREQTSISSLRESTVVV